MKVATLASALLLSAFSFASQAAWVSTDWKVAGDAKASLDDSTGIEWLDLTQTDFKSIQEVQGLLSTTYAGWRFPTAQEVRAMMTSIVGTLVDFAGDADGVIYKQGNMLPEVTKFRTLFGHTYSISGFSFAHISVGNYIDEQGDVVQAGVRFSGYDRGRDNYLYQDYSVASITSVTSKHNYYGVFLVSDGGTTLSSIQNPTLNANNPNAPVNQVPPTPEPEPETSPTDVSAPVGMAAFMLAFMGLGLPAVYKIIDQT